MATTKTGSFPIGFRRGGSDWQKNLSDVIQFAGDHDFPGIDVGAIPVSELKQILESGLRIGTVDLPQPWPDLMAADQAKRQEACDRCSDYIREVVDLGVRYFFVVLIPEDHTAGRKENFDKAVEGYGRLCEQVQSTGARILIEGWPGMPPHFSSLACTPADYRLVLESIGSEVMGVNYDPSHLVRMGIDPIRFLETFGPRVFHVHGKDTELFQNELYEYGNLQQATIAKSHRYGGYHWRYTIPGHGVVRWGKLFTILADLGYDGMVSIELEDENFNGTLEGEQRGLIASRDFLVHV